MKSLYIPEIGDIITLEKDWTFTLYPEFRNEKLGSKLGVYKLDTTLNYTGHRWFDGDKSFGHFPRDWNSETQTWDWKKHIVLLLIPVLN